MKPAVSFVLRAVAVLLGSFIIIAAITYIKIWSGDKNSIKTAGEGQSSGTVAEATTGTRPDSTEAPGEVQGSAEVPGIEEVSSAVPGKDQGPSAVPGEDKGPTVATRTEQGSTALPGNEQGSTALHGTEQGSPKLPGNEQGSTAVPGTEQGSAETPETAMPSTSEDSTKAETPTTSDQTQTPQLAENELYHQVLSEFCREVMEPIGFSLTDEYFDAGKDPGSNLVLLYFTSQRELGFEAKKQAAVKLGEFIYTEFEKKTGLETDYLKVHLKLPEGESFALTREGYKKWASSGKGYDTLFEDYMANMITRD